MTRSLAALNERFSALAAELNAQDWTLLGALASEQALPQTVIEQLSPAPAMPAAAWLKRAETAGWVVSARLPRSGSLKPHFSVHPDFEQLVLRRLASTGELNEISAVMRRLLTLRSVSDLTSCLQAGKLSDFLRRFAARKRAPDSGPSTRAEWLRRSLCEPFDPAWLIRTWAGDAERVATLVLSECLIEPTACDELYAWLEQRSENAGANADPELCAALYQHALLRGRMSCIARLVPLVSSEHRAAFGAAVHFAEGDLASAQEKLDQLASRGRKRGAIPDCGGLAPLLALLACSRDTEEGRALAKRIVSASDGELNRGALRALRTLLRHLTEAPEDQRRLDVHQLSADVGAWEISILALTVHLHSSDQWARANWCQELLRRARNWQGAGYEYLARQAYFLAQTLNQPHFEQELARLQLTLPLARSARELVLWDLISTKPEWQKALDALALISDQKPLDKAHGYRVTWYVDMVHGELNRPALQECRPDEGWSEGRRTTLSELHALYAELPAEDQRVLDCTREQHNGQRDFTADAPEALIGHPRVVNGLRARAPVEVVRGTPRIETREERGYVQVFVEPQAAVLGVNVVPESETRLLVYRVPEAIFRASEALRGGTRVPKSHERELLTVLGKLAERVEVRSPELGSERVVEADPTPCIRFALHAGAWLVQLGVRPFSEQGRFFLAGVGRAHLNSYSGGQRLRCERDLQLERDRNLALRQACPTLSTPPDPDEQSPFDTPDSWTLGEEGVLQLLSELRDAGLPCALEWPESGAMRLSALASSKTLHGRLRTDKGWYLVTGGVRIDSVTEITLNELLRAPALGHGRFVRLANGAYVEVEARIRRVLAALRAVNSSLRNAAELRLPHSALHTLAELNAPDSGFQLDVESQSWLERAARLSRKDFALPSDLRATLRPYQIEGYRWLSALSELGLGACLADDMGLGKTIQILALILARVSEGSGPTLVVAPTSVCGNWIAEIARFAPTLTALDYSGKQRAERLAALSGRASRASVVVCSYTLLQQDQAELSALSWDMVVLDEAQFIKNPQSLRARAAYSLSAKQRVAATGTPVENHLGDVWGIFRFLNPGLLGDWQHFKHTFLMPVERDAGRESTELLQKLVRPFLLRRLKRDVLVDLPPLTEVQHDVQLSQDEGVRYALLRKQIHEKLYTVHGKRNNKLEVLAEIMRLRRFCCHPALVFPDAPRECSKIDAFLDLVEELRENQHRALVFSQFVDFLAMVREQLDERRIRYEYLDGGTPQADRQARVAAFQQGDAPLFLISLKAGGFGLNLTAADYVIHLDPWWNPAVQAQATDRAHRIGQERPVTVYRLVTRDSIEESIVKMHESKRELAGALLDDGDAIAGISTDELIELLGESLAQPA